MGRHLRSSHRSFVTRTAELLADFHLPAPGPGYQGVHGNNREWCVLALHDAWVAYCRSLVLTSAVSGSRTLTGVVVPAVAGIRNVGQAVAAVRVALAPNQPSFWEPRWGDARHAIRAAQVLRINNFAQVSGALGSTPSPAEEIRTLRNYMAHRNRSTATPVRELLGVTGAIDPALDSYLTGLVGPLESRYSAWVRELREIALVASR